MYNYQKHIRESRLNQKCQSLRKSYLETTQKREKRAPSMIQSYKKRIEGFVLAMIQKPINIQVYKHRKYEPRPKDKKKIIAHKAFYLNHHLEKERIQEQQQRNANLDGVPFKNSSTHNFRDFSSHDLRPLKYTPSTSSLRVKQTIEKQTLKYLINNKNKKIDHIIKNQQKPWLNKNVQKMLTKSLLPNLHQKTHFHSVKTLYSQSLCGFLKSSKIAVDKQNNNHELYGDIFEIKQEEKQNQVDQKKQQEKSSNDYLNRKQNSKEALLKCGLLKFPQKQSHNKNKMSLDNPSLKSYR